MNRTQLPSNLLETDTDDLLTRSKHVLEMTATYNIY